MSVIHIQQIRNKICDAFATKIDTSDIADKDKEKDIKITTRCLAAYAVHYTSGCSEQEAADAVVDGGNDNGIDAIYLSNEGELFVVQSKYSQDGTGEPSCADVSKFCRGVKDLINEKFDRFNSKIQGKAAIIQQALGAFNTKYVLLLIDTHAKKKLAEHASRVINDLLDEMNNNGAEIQYRTRIQHAWSTTVEIIGLITENQPKFQRGNDDRYERSMVYASEILARAHENMKGPLPDIENNELVKSFITLSNEIHLLQRLKGLNTTNTEISKKKNAILIFKTDGTLEIKTFKDAPDALTSLFILGKEIPHDDIVLVRADTSQEVREAYKNYFSDARDFIRLIEEGCEKLYANALLLDTLDKYNTDKDTTVNAKKLYFPTVFNLRSVSCK